MCVLIVAVGACARFQPTAPAFKASDYTLAGQEQSFTLKDKSVHYNPDLLRAGVSRNEIKTAFGEPNSSRTTDSGLIEDVYAFNPDGTKFVNPTLRARNLALGFFTMGTSVAVRQARLHLTEQKLTLFHVNYGANDTISAVTQEKLPGAPAALPPPPSGSSDPG